MESNRYSATVAEGSTIAENVTYDELVTRVLDFVLRAAIARSVDTFEWEQEEVLRNGLAAIDFFSNGKALWWDREAFDVEMDCAKRVGVHERFLTENELDAEFLKRLDGDLRERLKRAGYATSSLVGTMKDLYREIEADVSDRSAQACQALVTEILRG